MYTNKKQNVDMFIFLNFGKEYKGQKEKEKEVESFRIIVYDKD
jgi:hypothetical protein